MPLPITFLASDSAPAQEALARLVARHGNAAIDRAQVIVALGGDGFMLQTLHASKGLAAPVYGGGHKGAKA